ncbi:MAG: hypothetical protein ABL901_00495 [Hyphomicrobiaceae bacterium]
MPFSIYTVKLLGLAQTLHRWLGVLCGLDRANRERIAGYAEAIAATLARAASALTRLDGVHADAAARAAARMEAQRELGRITGYVETIVAVLEQHLDGRKLAGVKRRLDQLDVERFVLGVTGDQPSAPGSLRADRLLAAEGYFRALADGLRA